MSSHDVFVSCPRCSHRVHVRLGVSKVDQAFAPQPQYLVQQPTRRSCIQCGTTLEFTVDVSFEETPFATQGKGKGMESAQGKGKDTGDDKGQGKVA